VIHGDSALGRQFLDVPDTLTKGRHARRVSEPHCLLRAGVKKRLEEA
jgi:hypothetical protein